MCDLLNNQIKSNMSHEDNIVGLLLALTNVFDVVDWNIFRQSCSNNTVVDLKCNIPKIYGDFKKKNYSISQYSLIKFILYCIYPQTLHRPTTSR